LYLGLDKASSFFKDRLMPKLTNEEATFLGEAQFAEFSSCSSPGALASSCWSNTPFYWFAIFETEIFRISSSRSAVLAYLKKSSSTGLQQDRSQNKVFANDFFYYKVWISFKQATTVVQTPKLCGKKIYSAAETFVVD
jgi:hypothetical protein